MFERTIFAFIRMSMRCFACLLTAISVCCATNYQLAHSVARYAYVTFYVIDHDDDVLRPYDVKLIPPFDDMSRHAVYELLMFIR